MIRDLIKRFNVIKDSHCVTHTILFVFISMLIVLNIVTSEGFTLNEYQDKNSRDV